MGAKGTSPLKRLGAWLSRTNNTVYQALTDGTVQGRAAGTGALDARIKTDSANPPTNTRIQSRLAAAGTSQTAGVTSKVKKNDYWKAEGCLDAVFWIPSEP